MLSGQAQTYYYANRDNASTFDQFCINMQLFFEGPKWQCLNLTKWQTISLTDMISTNPTLSTTKCLRKLCTELDTIQKSVDPTYHGTVHLKENIIQACKGYPALAADLTNPPGDTSGLVNNLYISTVNYEAIYKPVQRSYLHKNKNNELYFTDCQYWRGGFRSHGQGYNKFGNISRAMPQPSSQRKKCFVCGKDGCWSTNHLQQERDNSKKRFRNQFPKYKGHARYERYLQQYIAHYKGNDEENNTNDVAYFFKELSINASKNLLTNVDITDELFLSSINALQNIESTNTINLLANNVFKHQIISTNGTVALTSPVPYSFTTLTDLWYDKSKFKGLLIDSSAATRSISGIGQLTALQKIILLAKLDKTMARSANFIFGIGSTSSIGTVNLDTFMGMIIFHIVQVNTPFLLCFADMDKLGAYFNNLTNEVVQSNRSHLVICKYGHVFLYWCILAYFITAESFM